MTYVLFYTVLAFLLVRLGIAAVNLFSRPYLRESKDLSFNAEGLLSVMVPLRNEAHNVNGLLNSLTALQWPDMEILLLDDDSTDDTWALLEVWAERDRRIKVFRGEPLPAGWLGKNWACHQLAARAAGDYFLFVDADVRLHPLAPLAAIAELRKRQLALLSIFPDQDMLSLGEKLVVPLMHYLFLSLLPLKIIRTNPSPVFAAANGQFMLFQASAYRPHSWHERMRLAVTEDIRIQQDIKKEGLPTETLLAGGLVSCRMYTSYKDAIKGFSKNFLAFFGWNPVLMALYLGLTVLCFPWLFVSLSWQYMLCLCTGIILLKAAVSVMGRQSIIQQLLLQPAQALVSVLLAVSAAYRTYTHSNTWKGRKLS